MIGGFILILVFVLVGANILAYLQSKEPPTNANIRVTRNNPDDCLERK